MLLPSPPLLLLLLAQQLHAPLCCIILPQPPNLGGQAPGRIPHSGFHQPRPEHAKQAHHVGATRKEGHPCGGRRAAGFWDALNRAGRGGLQHPLRLLVQPC